MTRLVGITGYKRHGKGEAARALISRGWVNVKFADALKNMLRALLQESDLDDDMIERMIEGDLKEKPHPILCGKSPRDAMVTLGTDWGRDMIGQTLWTGVWQARARSMMAFWNVVTDDVRFPNEEEALRRMGGVLIKVIRPNWTIDESHPSERAISKLTPDFTIVNGGTLDELFEAVNAIREKL